MYLLKSLIEKWEHRAQSCTPVPEGLSECLRDAKLEVAKETERFYQLKTLDMPMPFGKYKGLAIWKVIDIDLGYMNWCMTKIETFRLDELAHNYYCQKEKENETSNNK